MNKEKCEFNGRCRRCDSENITGFLTYSKQYGYWCNDCGNTVEYDDFVDTTQEEN